MLTENEKGELNRLLVKFADEIHRTSKDKGFYDNWGKADCHEKILRIHGEVAELAEAYNQKHFERDKHLQDELNIDVELADIIIRCLDFNRAYGLCRDIGLLMDKKVQYNKTRERLHGKRG